MLLDNVRQWVDVNVLIMGANNKRLDRGGHMKSFKTRQFLRLAVSASALAIIAAPGVAAAQDTPAVTPDNTNPEGEIVVSGIRASLRQSMDIKRDNSGVVDAISAEDIGKFPDTNLAESLQRITGVSIDRQNGEGQLVTVRGFGPEFNLVTLNGRQMPTALIGDGGSAPAGRSFDFADLASEAIAGVEVYKTGRAAIPTGGIGSSINIRTSRPFDKMGLRGGFSVKGVYDTSRNSGHPITPEISGLISDTFGNNDVFGILISGSYQKRKSSFNQANVGWRDGYLGSENNWGSLAMPPDPRAANITNRPDATDVYQVPQNASYDLNDVNRERINGQAVLQIRPADSVTATIDYTYSRNTVETRNSNVGIWFNHNDTSSSWTDGPVAGPIFYTERFTAGERKDLSYSGAVTNNRSENKSLGGNITWDGPGGVTMVLDAHHSTAEVNPVKGSNSSVSVGNAIFGIKDQTINFDNELPVISYNMYPGIDPLNKALITPTGNAFRTAYFKDTINQFQVKGHWDNKGSFLDSVDFGVSYVDNKVRSAFGVIQNDTWGGAGPASDIPDDIFHLTTLPDKFGSLAQPGMIQSFYTFDFERMVGLIDQKYHTCGGDGDCTAPFTTDRRISEKTISPYLQANIKFDAFGNPSHIVAGVRYDSTDIRSSALVPVPSGTVWVGDNEFDVVQSGASDFTTFGGKYQNWLPSIDFDIEPINNVKFRASYSHTITRPDYANMQGGRTVDQLFRVGGGTGLQGNPNLLPYKSKNIDVSLEWYYGKESYVSAGFFHKDVSNFISTTRFDTNAFGLRTPVGGPRYLAAQAAGKVSAGDIRQYIFCNYPGSVVITGGTACGGNAVGQIQTLPQDPLLNFQITTPVNSGQTATLYGWEFAVQHSFWNTGFGVILNYTIVRGDATYDNTQPSTVPQFALVGLSDSANAVLFYDKGGLQARVAYNWRDQFLSGTGVNPFYIESYGQVDASASYEFMKGLTVFAEGINLTNQGRRGHLRSDRNVGFVATGDARYDAGVRFTF
jgi:TonB-dependent receptor